MTQADMDRVKTSDPELYAELRQAQRFMVLNMITREEPPLPPRTIQ